MKIQTSLFLVFFTMLVLSSCGAIETVFKAGMWWAFFLVGLVVILIIWILAKTKK
ncbi:MAG TPA: hypothetical protein VK644_03520 [Chitinophagaceae bacterium]|nr:hypothetical protein [Chitinophagaceae bacterium]